MSHPFAPISCVGGSVLRLGASAEDCAAHAKAFASPVSVSFELRRWRPSQSNSNGHGGHSLAKELNAPLRPLRLASSVALSFTEAAQAQPLQLRLAADYTVSVGDDATAEAGGEWRAVMFEQVVPAGFAVDEGALTRLRAVRGVQHVEVNRRQPEGERRLPVAGRYLH